MLLLDINLGKGKNGIDFAELLQEKYGLPFIFLTANSDAVTIQKAKQVKPLAFLVKPFTQSGLFSCIEIAMSNYETSGKNTNQQDNFLFVKVGYQFTKIFFVEIIYMETNQNYIRVYKMDGTELLVRKSLSEIQELLPQNEFTKISRYHIVNHQYIQEIKTNTILINGEEISISKTGREELISKV